MSDDVDARLIDMVAQIDRERTPQSGETLDELNQRMHERNAAEIAYLRSSIINLSRNEISDAEVRGTIRRLADDILLRKAAYAEWRKAYQAKFNVRT